jgi:cytidylate kinase
VSRGLVVAIDGPAGAGKSTVARRVAETLGYRLVDTGALYRSVALAAKERGVSWEEGPALGALAAGLTLSLEGTRPILDGVDRGDDIRTPEMSLGASAVSKHPEVRTALLGIQRRLGREPPGAVLEGRDIGTVVFPDAEHKFFLTASAEARARRRFEELRAKGSAATYEETLADQKQRDAQDEGRAVAPLVAAPDAELVDTTSMTIDEVVAQIVSIVRGSG